MEKLSIYTLYKSPLDHPNKFVIRRWENDKPTKDFWIGDTREEVEAKLPLELIWMERHPTDDPVILGVWI